MCIGHALVLLNLVPRIYIAYLKQDACLTFLFSTSERAKLLYFFIARHPPGEKNPSKICPQVSCSYIRRNSAAFFLRMSLTGVLFRCLQSLRLPVWSG